MPEFDPDAPHNMRDVNHKEKEAPKRSQIILPSFRVLSKASHEHKLDRFGDPEHMS